MANNSLQLFGFEIKRKPAEDPDIPSFVSPESDDGALTVAAGGAYGTYLDLEGSAKTEADLVSKYREMALQPECELAVDEVVNEAIVKDGNEEIVDINLDNLDVTDNIKNLIIEEWNNCVQLLNFNNFGYELFRRWYIDGRMFYHVMIDETNPRAGIQELRYIDPRKIRKVRSVKRERKGKIFVNSVADEFYMYTERVYKGNTPTAMDNTGLKIAKDSIVHITSGLMDKDNKLVLGYLHKAIKPLNQLRMLEDATVIYRLSRAPERRIFYIDVGNLPKAKAEQYMRDMMNKHKNRLVYDAVTGEVKDSRKYMTMMEDYWLARREGNRGTEISTLPSGQNLGELTDVNYFQKSLYKALSVPMSRINPESTGFNMGRSMEITQDELKFQKFINRLRLRFSQLFLQVLEKQLILKAVLTTEDWEIFKNKIHFNFHQDNYFSELKDAEILRERLTSLQQIEPYIGRFYSTLWVKKNILQQSDEDIKKMQSEMDKEPPPMMMGPDGQPMQPEPSAPEPKTNAEPKAKDEDKPEPKPSTARKQPVKGEIVQGSNGPFTRKQPERLPDNFK